MEVGILKPYPQGCACGRRSRRPQTTPQPFSRSGNPRLSALGSRCLPCRSRSARCNARSKSIQVPIAAQAPEMGENRLPRWKVGWEVAPRATRTQHVEDRIEDGSQGVSWRSATFGQGRQIALQARPLRI